MAKHKSPTELELEQSYQALEDQIARAMVDRAIDIWTSLSLSAASFV
jgi:hypothetical protein